MPGGPWGAALAGTPECRRRSWCRSRCHWTKNSICPPPPLPRARRRALPAARLPSASIARSPWAGREGRQGASMQRAALFSGGDAQMAAGDLGELLVPYMPTIRVPKSGDRVYKTECAFSYDSPVSAATPPLPPPLRPQRAPWPSPGPAPPGSPSPAPRAAASLPGFTASPLPLPARPPPPAAAAPAVPLALPATRGGRAGRGPGLLGADLCRLLRGVRSPGCPFVCLFVCLRRAVGSGRLSTGILRVWGNFPACRERGSGCPRAARHPPGSPGFCFQLGQ